MRPMRLRNTETNDDPAGAGPWRPPLDFPKGGTKMGSYRASRTEEDMKRELSDIMRSLKDPRVTGLLSIVKLELARDLSHCKVYISLYGWAGCS